MSDKSNIQVNLFGLSQCKHTLTFALTFSLSVSLSLSLTHIHTYTEYKTLFDIHFYLTKDQALMKMEGIILSKKPSFSKRVKRSLGMLIVHCHSAMTSQ